MGDSACSDDGHCDTWCPDGDDPDCEEECECDFTDDICEPEAEDSTTDPCACDGDCDGAASACQDDGHCDTWCDVDGTCKDPDCPEFGTATECGS